VVLVSCTTRAATLTVSPIKVNSSVDTDADPQRAAESLGHKAEDQQSRSHRRVGMIRQIIRGAEHRQRAIAEELVDMPAGVDD
jgi:hypothetical protein